MGRKKIDKTSFDYLCKSLFHKEDITGFQFTIDAKDNILFVDLSTSRKSSVVIDCGESDVLNKIGVEVFGEDSGMCSCFSKTLTLEQIEFLKTQFLSEGYEVEEVDDFCGKWIWLRVKCKYDEIPSYVEKLKNIFYGKI